MRLMLSQNPEFSKRLPKSGRKLLTLQDYTYLFPHVEERTECIDKLMTMLCKYHQFDKCFINESYTYLLSLFDGGMLFGTNVYSISSDHGDESVDDLLTINELLSSARAIPRGTFAIGTLSYGHDLLMRFDREDNSIYIWDSIVEECTGHWNSIDDWLLEECEVAEKLLAEGLLEKMED